MLSRPASWILASMVLATGSAIAADRIHVVNEGGIRDQWMLADGVQLVAPGYPAAFAERGDSVCVAIGYAIQPDGKTANFALLRNWTGNGGEREPVEGYWEAFAKAGAAALSQWRFKPRPEVTSPQTTYTVATMQFTGKDGLDPAVVRSHCAISDLATVIQQKKVRRYEQGTMERKEMERLRRTQEADRSLSAPLIKP